MKLYRWDGVLDAGWHGGGVVAFAASEEEARPLALAAVKKVLIDDWSCRHVNPESWDSENAAACEWDAPTAWFESRGIIMGAPTAVYDTSAAVAYSGCS